VNTAPVISNQLVRALIQKYADFFHEQFPFASMNVYFTENGLPPLPPGVKREAPKQVFGATIRVGKTQRIGIHRQLPPPARLSTFFHEYGHAVYRTKSNEDDSEGLGLVRSETAAMLSSLNLPDQEGLPEIAVVSAAGILKILNLTDEYRQAFENISTNPLWLKYAPLAGAV
jgi:hypothetical protein